MAVLEIRKYPDDVLKKVAEPVNEINGELQKLIDDMIETMYSSNGVGLAASQVGVLKRIIIVDTSSRQEGQSLLVLINPEIVDCQGEILSEEGCLSIPGFITKLKRKEKVFLRALDRQGNPVEIEADGLLSRALQHEVDHLNGVLIVDRLSPLKKELFRRKYSKLKK